MNTKDQAIAPKLEFLLDGARVKLNFNKIGNMTSLQNLQHELQGRWVAFIAAENDVHLKAMNALDQPPAPNCRTCDNFDTDKIDDAGFWYCEKAEAKTNRCTNGDKYQPAPALVLWRTE